MCFPLLIKPDSEDLMLAGLNKECGPEVPCEILLPPRNDELLAFFCGQLE